MILPDGLTEHEPLVAVGRDPKQQQGQRGQNDGRTNEHVLIEDGHTLHRHRDHDGGIVFHAIRNLKDTHLEVEQVPFVGLWYEEVAFRVPDGHQGLVVRRRSQVQMAGLRVVRKQGQVEVTEAAQSHVRKPGHAAVVPDDGQFVQNVTKGVVCAVNITNIIN